jgi:hypothetical protein
LTLEAHVSLVECWRRADASFGFKWSEKRLDPEPLIRLRLPGAAQAGASTRNHWWQKGRKKILNHRGSLSKVNSMRRCHLGFVDVEGFQVWLLWKMACDVAMPIFKGKDC